LSKDFQLGWPCPHLTVEEVVSLGNDRRSLDVRQPVGGSATVRVLANDEVFIPQGGLYSSAQLFSTISGPYDMVENENVLTIEGPGGSQTFSFSVVGHTRLTATQVLKELAAKQLTVAQATEQNGHLVFYDNTHVGNESFINISGTASNSLGFGNLTSKCSSDRQCGARGSLIYPGWQLHLKEDTITNRFPKFIAPVRSNPIFKVTYAVPPNRCLRCGGTRIENDFRYDTAGQLLEIENEDLLYQACLKIILTDKGTNPYHPWYGTSIRSRIGSKAISGVATVISEDVRRALAKLQTLQTEQAKYQSVSFKERIYAVQRVDVAPHVQNPTVFKVDVAIQNASAEPIDLSIVYTVPEVVAMMGSNGLMLGAEAVGLEAGQAAKFFAELAAPRFVTDK